MVNDVLDAISTQLYSTFGDGYRYYVEDIEQKLTKPCFTIDTLIPLQRSKSPFLYDRTMPMVIHHFTDDTKDTKKTLYAKAEEIVECLEYLPFKNTLLRGENISYQIVEEVLQVFVTYKFTTKSGIRIITGDTMDDMVETITHGQ